MRIEASTRLREVFQSRGFAAGSLSRELLCGATGLDGPVGCFTVELAGFRWQLRASGTIV
jgi:hypothetical protein